jgi:RNA polymerase sigma-70 factor (ECF subfamily)
MDDRGIQTEAMERRLQSLMVQGLDGNAAAYRELLDQLGRLLIVYFARRLGGGSGDAEDLVQEVLIAVHTRRATYDRGRPFTAWAHTIARYKLIDHYRRSRAHAAIPIDDAGELFAADRSEEATAKTDLKRLMADLPEKQRQAIQQVKLEELPVAEAAERTGMSQSAVKVSVHRGLKALAARIRGDG